MSASAAANDRNVVSSSCDDLVEEMPPGAILNLDDPYVGIETHFARETFLDLGLGGRQFTKASDEEPVCGTRIVEDALRRRSEQLGGPIKPIELDEYGSGLFGAAPADGRERAFDVAAADIGGNPDCGFKAHSKFLAGPAPRTHGRSSIHHASE